jgi:hypothetical protein
MAAPDLAVLEVPLQARLLRGRAAVVPARSVRTGEASTRSTRQRKRQNRLPIWILGKIGLGQQLPEVNAVVFVVVLTIIPVVISQRLTQESGILRRE